MKVGDYVRTKHYGIAKIINVYNNTTTFYSSITIDKIDSFRRFGVNVSNDEIIKSSPNIIDLIEIGDYVNGVLINIKDDKGVYHGAYDCADEVHITKFEDIKSIVTYEQFQSMKYKVGK